METLILHTEPVAETAMLIRKPVAEVFEAVVNPAIIIKYWFTKSSGRLEAGKTVRWDWEMYNVFSIVTVLALEENQCIEMDWGNDVAGYTRVVWEFSAYDNKYTFLNVVNTGFAGTGDDKVKSALGSTGGFTWVLAGMKAWLEHGMQLNLVADRFPAGLPKG